MRHIVSSWAAGSLSARRAWIEIWRAAPSSCICMVALRKESVDRNRKLQYVVCDFHVSLSARRAWIEIDIDDKFGGLVSVSLSARRAWIEMSNL